MIPQEVLEQRQFYLNQLPEVKLENQRHLERYKKLILSRPERDLVKDGFLYNLHHIFPRSMSTCDEDLNLIKLTHREHFIAHLILYKCGYKEMISAFWFTFHTRESSGTLTSKQYARLRENFSDFIKARVVSEEQRQHQSEAMKNRVMSEEHKQNLSKASKGVPKSEKHKQTLAIVGTGRKQSEKTVKQRAEKNKGKKRTEQQKDKMRGEKNPMKGKSIVDIWKEKYPDIWEEKYNEWTRKQSESQKKHYESTKKENPYKNKSNEELQEISRKKSKGMKEYWNKKKQKI